MSLKLRSFCSYPSKKAFNDANVTFNQLEWNCWKMIQAIKGKQFNGYAYFPVGRAELKFYAKDRERVTDIFGQWAATTLKNAPPGTLLVPVPSSSLTTHGGDCTALRLCVAAQKHAPATNIAHMLAFKVARPADHERGENDEAKKRQSIGEILANLKHSGLPSASNLVLVDDVCTQGHHFKASAKYLRGLGYTVSHAYCAGRTVWERAALPYDVADDDLEVPSSLQQILARLTLQ